MNNINCIHSFRKKAYLFFKFYLAFCISSRHPESCARSPLTVLHAAPRTKAGLFSLPSSQSEDRHPFQPDRCRRHIHHVAICRPGQDLQGRAPPITLKGQCPGTVLEYKNKFHGHFLMQPCTGFPCRHTVQQLDWYAWEKMSGIGLLQSLPCDLFAVGTICTLIVNFWIFNLNEHGETILLTTFNLSIYIIYAIKQYNFL